VPRNGVVQIKKGFQACDRAKYLLIIRRPISVRIEERRRNVITAFPGDLAAERSGQEPVAAPRRQMSVAIQSRFAGQRTRMVSSSKDFRADGATAIS
jgi:hypothetical protein